MIYLTQEIKKRRGNTFYIKEEVNEINILVSHDETVENNQGRREFISRGYCKLGYEKLFSYSLKNVPECKLLLHYK